MKGIILLLTFLCAEKVFCQQTCPKPEDIYPCYCYEVSATQSQIDCSGEDLTEVDLYRAGQKISSPTGKFFEFYLRDSKVGIIPANTFSNITFTNIIIENNGDLKHIDPFAFKKSTVTKLVIRRNKSLEDTHFFDLVRNTLTVTDTLQLDANGFKDIPANAFTPANPATSKLKKIFLGRNMIDTVHEKAFFGLPMLTTVGLDFNEVENISPHALEFSPSVTPREITVRLNDNGLDETAFHRGAIVVPQNVTLKLHLETNQIEYFPEYEFAFLSQPGNSVYLEGNPEIHCDCTSRWIYNVIHNSTVSGLKCFNFENRDIRTLNATDICVI